MLIAQAFFKLLSYLADTALAPASSMAKRRFGNKSAQHSHIAKAVDMGRVKELGPSLQADTAQNSEHIPNLS